MVLKVTDPKKIATDPVLLSHLAKQGIDPEFVEFFQDYAPRNLGKEHSPYAKFYRDLNSNKRFMVISGLPMVDADGVKIEVGWRVTRNHFTEKNNLFRAKVQGTQVEITIRNDQPDGRKTGDKLTYKPQLFLNGIEQPCGSPVLLPVDPLNPNYLKNTLEWDWGVCKRRLRIIEGWILGSWVFPGKPAGVVRIKYNQTGDYKLRLGQFKVNDDEEVVKPEDFDELALRQGGYSVTISDSATFSPDAHTETTSVDGEANHVDANGLTWAQIIAAAGTGFLSETSPGSGLVIRSDANTDKWDWLSRPILLFDTSGLPDNAIKSAAVLSMRGSAKSDYWNWAPDANIYSSKGRKAANAGAAQTTPTYDGSGQMVHPSIVYFPDGWHGYKYWLAMTPFPSSDYTKENPSILACNDGVSWEVPAGLTNPIEPAPGGAETYSDSHLIYNASTNELWYYFGWTNSVTASKIYLKKSSDGVNWGTKIQVLADAVKADSLLSQSIVMESSSLFYMWVVDGSVSGYPKTMKLYSSPSGDGVDSFTFVSNCTFNYIPQAGGVWHQNIWKHGNIYCGLMLCYLYNTGDSTGAYLVYGESTDKVAWTLDTWRLLSPAASGWDSGAIYRATGFFNADKTILYIWYSAWQTVASLAWHMGYTAPTISFTALSAADYGTLGSTPFCDVPVTYANLLVDGNFTDFTLNAAGIGAIPLDGVSKFSIRNANYDVAASSPTWHYDPEHTEGTYWSLYYAEQGNGYKPKLVVTYNLPTTQGKIGSNMAAKMVAAGVI